MDGKDVLNYYTNKAPLKEKKVNPIEVATAILSKKEIEQACLMHSEELFLSLLQDYLDYSNKVWKSISRKGRYSKADFDVYQSTAAAYYKALSLMGEDIKKHRQLLHFIYDELSKDNFDGFDRAIKNIIFRTKRHLENFGY